MSMASPESASLKALRDQPYELLAELERRGRNATASPESSTDTGSEWVGVAVRMAGELYLVAREEAREVLGVPAPLTRVPGARAWLLGLASLRGQLLPVIDLRQFLGGGATPASRTTRIVVANHRDVPAALVVDEVLGFRRFPENGFSTAVPPTIVPCARFLAGSFLQDGSQLPVLSLRRLLEDATFLAAST
jgi:twitching motility protein PilI